MPVATAPEEPVQPVAPPEASGPKVIFVGDSIAAGLHVSEDEAFPAVLQRLLAERGASFQLVNAGVSGDTTAGGLSRIDWLLKQKPAIVVVELGANDAMRGVAPAEVEKNLRAILGKIDAAGAKALLLGMRIPSSYGEEHASAFAQIYDRLAAELHLASVPFFMNGVAGVASLNQEDGIHPTAQGHIVLAGNVENALLKLVREAD